MDHQILSDLSNAECIYFAVSDFISNNIFKQKMYTYMLKTGGKILDISMISFDRFHFQHISSGGIKYSGLQHLECHHQLDQV